MFNLILDQMMIRFYFLFILAFIGQAGFPQNCKTAVIAPFEQVGFSADTCYFPWYEESDGEILIPSSVSRIIFKEVHIKEVFAATRFTDLSNITYLKFDLGEYDYDEGDIQNSMIKKFENLKQIELNIHYLSPHLFLQLKKTFPLIRIDIQDERKDLSRQYKGIAMSEPDYNLAESDTFYLIGYNWDGQESWNAIYELNRNTIERLIISKDWESEYKFDFTKFPKLKVVVLTDYDRFEEIGKLVSKASKNKGLGKIILRNCALDENELKSLKNKYKKFDLSSENQNDNY